jgi:hypothetical protein
MLLPDLEAIKQVMVEKHSQKLKAKGKGGTAQSKAKSNPKRKESGVFPSWRTHQEQLSLKHTICSTHNILFQLFLYFVA